MEPIKLTLNELLPYVIAVNAVLGLMFGLFPLITGLKMNDRKYAFIGLIGSVVSGTLVGVILSFPFAAVMVWLILRKHTSSEQSSTSDIDTIGESGLISSENN